MTETRAQLYTTSPQTTYSSLLCGDRKAHSFRCGSFSPQSLDDFVGASARCFCALRGLLQRLDGEKFFSITGEPTLPLRRCAATPFTKKGGLRSAMSTLQNYDHPAQSRAICCSWRCVSKRRKAVFRIRPENKILCRKKGIVYTEIMLPANAPPEYYDRNTLWNAAEKIEKQWNAQLARRIVLALPREVPADQYPAMLQDFCREHFVSQ